MPRSENSALPRNQVMALLHPWTWRMAWRDSRSQRLRLAIFSLAIVSGIASLVAIHSLEASVRSGIRLQAKSLLGSDLQISSRRPINDSDYDRLASRARTISRETSFPSMMKFLPDGGARLVQVRAIEGGYPYYGEVQTRPTNAWQRLRQESGVLLEPSLLDQFGVKIGDEVELGGIRLRILGVVEKPAPRSSRFMAFSPEAYVRLEDLKRGSLLGANSMSSYQVHLEIPNGPPSKALKDRIRKDFPDASWRLETPEDRRETMGDALENFQRFLGILAIASLALGAIGVAGAVHAHVNRRMATVAILRCLGCPGHVASAVYLAQAGALGLIGSLLGAGLGIALQVGVLAWFRDSLPIAVAPSPEWKAVLRTTAAGFAVCCGFALIPLLRIRRISPVATLRGGAMLAGRTFQEVVVYLLLSGLFVGLAWLQDSDWKRALAMVGGLAIAFAVLATVARGLMFLTRRTVNARWPYLLRQGISNLHRPGNQTLLFLLSLGLGTFLMLTILLAGNLLQQRLNITGSANSPNLYLIDVQPDQLDGVKDVMKKQNLPVLESAPMVTMRIQSVRGVPIRQVKGVPSWVARREFRSTYRESMNPTETLIAGKWHPSIPGPTGPVPLSLEEEIAKDLGVGVGDEMTLDVQGVPIDVKITSLRKVDWSQFNLNFFMVFPPGVLEDAPGFHVVTTRTPTPSASGELQRELVKSHANVSAIDLTQILGIVRDIVGKISTVISLLGGFTLLAALPILIGTLLNGRDVRLKESVLLRTLGASSRQVRNILVIEYATLGILAALTGTLLALAANTALAVYVFKASAVPDLILLASTFAAVTGISIIGGLALSRGVCTHPPLEILRGS